MAMQTSKQLFARRQELANSQRDLMAEGNENEAQVVEGQIRELDITLEHVLDEEERLRAEYKAAPAAPKSFGEAILGARDEFKGLEVGFRNEGDPTVVSVSGPREIELELPGKSASLLNNFAATLPSAPAKGSVEFKRRAAQIGAPDTWAGVTDGTSAAKEQVIYQWVDAVANKETIAGYVPISKDTLADYDDLLSIIESDLLIDLAEKRNAKYLNGNNSTSGIVGVLNTAGIQQYTTGAGGLYYEAIRKMRTLCMRNARRIPTHVCVHPDIKEAIDLYKTQQGYYQSLGDTYWGMIPVEDFDCPGVLVYDAFAAKKRPVHGTSVEVGYVNDQFVKNELSLLAEETSCLQVLYPDAFVYATKTALDA